MIFVVILFLFGISLSAFFSGSETGFYRVSRMRLLIDALTGDWIARGLLWTTNHPSVFVATALVGNNVANYLCSLATVMGVELFFPGGQAAELLAPIFLAPIVFIYGELFPKQIFYEAPNRFLRRFGPGLLLAGVLFSPIIALLWLVNKFLQLVVRQSPQIIELVLARRELSEILAEGHEAGILQPAQQGLAQSMFSLGGRPLAEFAIPAGRYARATPNMTPDDVLYLARRQRRELIPVEEPTGKRELLGYLRVADLKLGEHKELPPLLPLVELRADERYLTATLRMIEAGHALGHVIGASGRTVGFITRTELTEALLSGDS